MESLRPYARHATGNSDRSERGAIPEGRAPYARHAVRDDDGGEAPTIIAQLFTDCVQAGWKCDFSQAACRECIVSDLFYALRYDEAFQLRATRKGKASDACHTVGNGDRGERGTIREGIFFDTATAGDDHGLQRFGDLVAVRRMIGRSENISEVGRSGAISFFANKRDGDGLDGVAAIEGIDPYARHAVGDSDGGERFATQKSAPIYACHTIRDDDIPLNSFAAFVQNAVFYCQARVRFNRIFGRRIL